MDDSKSVTLFASYQVIPIETRNDYMATLEEASVRKDIEPFSKFLAGLVQKG